MGDPAAVPHDPPSMEDNVCPICDVPWPCAERKAQRTVKKYADRLLRDSLFEVSSHRENIDGVPCIEWSGPGGMKVRMTYGTHGLVVRTLAADGSTYSQTNQANEGWLDRWLP